MSCYAMGPYDEESIKPEPWQLKTSRNAYTPYFVRSDQLSRYSNVTWMLSTGFSFPSSGSPKGIPVRVENSDSEETSMGDSSFEDGAGATRKAPRTSTRMMELRSANRSSPKDSSIQNGKDAPPVLLEASKIVKPKATPTAKPHFPTEAPSALSPSQKQRWNIAYSSLSKEMEFDPEHKRAYRELGRLTKLADLMGRSSAPFRDMRDWLNDDVE